MRRLWLTASLLGAAALLTALYLDGGGWVARWLTCSRDGILRGELWRLLSGPLVHASVGHAVRDLSTLVVLGLLWEGRARYRAALLLGLMLAPLLALAVTPALHVYLGLSGAVYAALGAGLVWQWRRGPRPLVAVVLVAVVAKVIIECATGQLLLSVGHPSGVAPIPVAHLAGLGCGALALVGPRGAPHGCASPAPGSRL